LQVAAEVVVLVEAVELVVCVLLSQELAVVDL
jgi:hypothetical protein